MNIDIKELFAKLQKKDKGIEVGGNTLVDLTPASYIEVIALRKHRKQWIYIFLSVVAVSLLAVVLFYAQFLNADMQLSNEQDAQAELDAQIAEYSDVNDVLVARDNAENTLTSAAGTEIDWDQAYDNIQSALPGDTSVSRMAVDVNENPGAMVSAAVQIDLTAGSTMSYSDTLGVISDLEEVNSVTIGGMERSGEDQYRFTMSFTYDESIKTGRYDFSVESEESAEDLESMMEDPSDLENNILNMEENAS